MRRLFAFSFAFSFAFGGALYQTAARCADEAVDAGVFIIAGLARKETIKAATQHEEQKCQQGHQRRVFHGAKPTG